MLIHRIAGVIIAGFVAFGGPSHAAAPSLAIHGPSSVYEASSAEFRAVVTWSDGTKSKVSASWTSSNPGLASVSPFGSSTILLVGSVGTGTTVTVGATYFDVSGPISTSKDVTVLDASAFPPVSHSLAMGWNLLGNSINAPLNVVAVFGDQIQPVPGVTDKILSVWKRDAVNNRWAYFSPLFTPTQLATEAGAKQYSLLQVVQPGEGYWVYATQPVSLPPQSAAPVSIDTNSIVSGWNLLATGQQQTPGALNAAVSGGFLSLWSWDAATAKWFYYTPAMTADALKAYTDAQGYLDFATLGRQLGHGIGFWVNSGTVNASSNLTPLGQAKAMFSELRTTVRAYSNDLKSGFLDAQSTRISNDLTGKVAPNLSWAIQYKHLISDATKLFVDVRDGNTASYIVEPGTAGGTVRASRTQFDGYVQVSCFSNDMAGTQVTPGLLTSASCTWVDFNDFAYTYSFPNRTQVTLRAKVLAGATTNDFNYEAIKRLRLETWNGSSFLFEFVSNSQIGATRTGAFSRTYLGATTNISNFSLAGELPPQESGADRDTVSLAGTRTLQSADIYRSSIAGAIASKSAGGATLVTLAIASGSYYDAKEDADGNPLPNSVQAVHIVGKAETSASRFTGTLDLNAFARDADNAEYVPQSTVFEGLMEDLSAGGAGTFLTGRLTVTLNNLAAFQSLQPNSASNHLLFDTAFVGTIQAPGRPEMRLTTGSVRTGFNTYAINTSYTYGPVSVTGVGTLDTLDDNNTLLTLNNNPVDPANGVTVTFRPFADAVVSKGGTTLGIIPFGSFVVYYIDGYFESL